MLELRVLGPLVVLGDDGELADVGGFRPRSILVAMALAKGHPISADRLIEDVWGGEQFTTRNRLQVHISRLRRALGDHRIVTQSGGYSLEMPEGALDIARFDCLVVKGREALEVRDAAGASRRLTEALDLWRGPVMAEFADMECARTEIARLEEAHLAAIEDRVDAELLLRRHVTLVGELEALVREHPLRERLWSQLILALYRSGRQGEALRAFQRARTGLAEELGIDPGPALIELEAAILKQDPALVLPQVVHSPKPQFPRRRMDNLPLAPNSLIGRSLDLEGIASSIHANRLVTIVGPGGVGKTRLAVEVGRTLVGDFRDGVWLVDFAAISDSTTVTNAISTALNVRSESGPGATTGALERLREFLIQRETLLLFDNCEHVVSEAARVADSLMTRCESLRILATSRESLAVAGESLWPLDALALDDAVTLFMERARKVLLDLEVVENSISTVDLICERLDCLPLAIELAAARLRTFAPKDILARLEDRFRLLTSGVRTASPRQQTLRAVVDWSYDLLFDEERRVFDALSIFPSSFTLHAAEEVCATDSHSQDEIAESLARLVDKSLVIAFHGEGGSTFRLLRTLADYGRARLITTRQYDQVCSRHARWVMSLVDVPDSEHGSTSPNWFSTVNEYIDDIRVAMEWTLRAGDDDTALAIACALGWYWNMGGRIDDCWKWLLGALALSESETPRRAEALAWAGMVGLHRDRIHALACGAEAVDLARRLNNRSTLALTAVLHGSVLTSVFPQRDRAIALLDEASRIFNLESDDWSRATASLSTGLATLAAGNPAGARPFLRDSTARFRRIGNPWAGATALQHLADIDVWSNQYGDAILELQEALLRLQDVGATGISGALAVRLGSLCAALDRFDEADSWHEQALAAAKDQRDVPLLALTYNAQGESLRCRWQLDEAEQWHRLALELFQERRVDSGMAFTLSSLGYIAEMRADARIATQEHLASLDIACGIHDRRAQARALEGLAGVASLLDSAHTTGLLLGAASSLRDVGTLLGSAVDLHQLTGGPMPSTERSDVDRAVARLSNRAAMDAGFATGLRDPDRIVTQVRSYRLPLT